MLKGLVSTLFGAMAIAGIAALPANAAEELETKLQVCNSCHGQNGQPIDATIPIIWGQTTAYLVKQLHDFKSRDRENAVMAAFADTLAQADLRRAAVYFTAKTWPQHATPASAAPAQAPNGMAVCRICHQPNFEGGLPAPRLAGQSYEFLVAQMRAFAEEERTNSADMVKLMKMLSASEREAMARYLAGL